MNDMHAQQSAPLPWQQYTLCPLLMLQQVSAAALELLQHLAMQHTRSKELEELLLEGPAGVPLLTYVGKALHTQTHLFVELAAQLKVKQIWQYVTLSSTRNFFASVCTLQQCVTVWTHLCKAGKLLQQHLLTYNAVAVPFAVDKGVGCVLCHL